MRAEIAAALSSHLRALNIPTQFENDSFKPVAGQVYVREQLLPGESINSINGAARAVPGIYQVTVMAPQGSTKGAGNQVADQIIAHFTGGRKLVFGGTTVYIIRAYSLASSLVGDRYATPITIDWRAHG